MLENLALRKEREVSMKKCISSYIIKSYQKHLIEIDRIDPSTMIHGESPNLSQTVIFK